MQTLVNKNLYALIENHERGPVKWENGEDGERRWAGGACPIVCLEGATRSGKTWSWLEYAINCGEMMPGVVISAFRHDASTHEKAAIRDFKRLMMEKYKPVWERGKWNNQLKTFTFENGSILEFCGTNDPAKLHGPERDIAIFNEVMEITYEAYRQIMSRTRLMVIMDWNPSLNSHWVFDKILTRSDVLYVHSTYKDNPHLTEKQVAEIEATNPDIPENVRNGTADAWYWEVYGLGKRGRREGAVFDRITWEITDDWPDPMMCDKHGYGLDFGFSNDPTALVECALFQGHLYLREWIYETGLITVDSHARPNTPSIQGLMNKLGVSKSSLIVADSARPDLIDELVREGFNVVKCNKAARNVGNTKKSSILYGIDIMKRFPKKVFRQSQKTQIEFEQYVWRRHANGDWLGEPEDKYNHAIDAARYWCMYELAGWQPVRHDTHRKTAQGRKRKRY